MDRCLAFLLFLCFNATLLGAQAPSTQPKSTVSAPKTIVYIKAGRLFDATSDAVKNNMVIMVANDRIQTVAPAAQANIPAGATVIDLSNQTVLPGLIDCHTHLSARADRYNPIYEFRDSPMSGAMMAVVNARKTLDAGFTTVRDVGSAPFVAVDLRKLIDEGMIPGPRVVASGPGISITGGHGDLNNYSPSVSVELYPQERGYGIADGPDQVRHV